MYTTSTTVSNYTYNSVNMQSSIHTVPGTLFILSIKVIGSFFSRHPKAAFISYFTRPVHFIPALLFPSHSSSFGQWELSLDLSTGLSLEIAACISCQLEITFLPCWIFGSCTCRKIIINPVVPDTFWSTFFAIHTTC